MTMIYLARHLIWPVWAANIYLAGTRQGQDTEKRTVERINECRQKRDLRLEIGIGFGFGFGLAKSMQQLDIFEFVRQTRLAVVAVTLVFVLGNLGPDGKFSCKMSFRADKLTSQIIMLTGCMDPVPETELKKLKQYQTKPEPVPSQFCQLVQWVNLISAGHSMQRLVT